jgi:hypothetical protein
MLSVSDAIQTLITTVEELENSTMELNSTAHKLEFDMDGSTYSPTETKITGVVDCEQGKGSDSFICRKGCLFEKMKCL